MSEPIVAIDTSEIREGRLEELKAAVHELVEFVDANEPRPIAYNVYLDERERRMTVVQVHPDSASMELHLKVAGPAFPRFTDLIELRTMDLYGGPSEELLQLVRNKAQLLGNVRVVLHERHAGFVRSGTA
ncbi:MAG TPA: hypothetical protein VFK59_02230 [Actinomycetota bacterium]|nr:hypothetical protein [Actinomycetota bacterium]